MKNIRKILALLIAALMTVSVMGMAFAASGPMIDPVATGSITIVKTEFQEHEKMEDGQVVMKDGKPVMEKVEIPLPGVTFDAYLIATIETSDVKTSAADKSTFSLVAKPVTELSKAWAAKFPGVPLSITGDTKYEDELEVVLKYMLESSDITFAPKASATTEIAPEGDTYEGMAVAVLEDLPVGVYLIVESDAPAQIVERSANFIVSMPMANATGDGWVYDFTAYPKNESVYSGAVILKKEGNNSGTILQGVCFKLQYEETQDNWVNVKNVDGTEVFVTDEYGKIEVEGLKPGNYRFTEIDRGHSGTTDLNTEYIIDKTKDYYFTVNNDKTFTCAYAGKTNVEGLEIIVNNYKPDLEKQVHDRVIAGDIGWGEMADYSVGDTIPYRIIVKVPQNIADLQTFKVTDTPRYVEDDLNTIVVGNLVKGTHYTVGASATAGGFVINFPNPADLSAYAGGDLMITYSATLLPGAVATNRADNTASLIYSNEVVSTGTPKETKIQDDTAVYTFGIDITKYLNKVSTTTHAKGGVVTFELYRENPVLVSTAQPLKFAADTNAGEYILDKTSANTAITVNGDGRLIVRGLANGTYYLVETQTEPGYNLLSAPIEVTINVSYKDADWDGTPDYKTDTTGAAQWLVVKHDVNELEQFYGGADADHANKPYAELDVVNKSGFSLPSTGGMGTTLFYLTGFVLAATGAVLLAGRRFKKTER